MININRVAQEVHSVGLYNLILQDVEKVAKKTKLKVEEVKSILLDNPEILKEYEQTNLEYNISNIHLRHLEAHKPEHSALAQEFNENLDELQSIEKYTLDFEQSSVLVIIMSIEFFVLFSAQYFIVLLNLKEWQIPIYGFFALSIVVAWFYAKSQRKLFESNTLIFNKLYSRNEAILEELEKDDNFKREKFYIEECDEHI